jgi:hypothetical protein
VGEGRTKKKERKIEKGRSIEGLELGKKKKPS